MEDLKIATQLESVLSCTAERSSSPLCMTHKNDRCKRGRVAPKNPAIFGKQLFKQSHYKCYFETNFLLIFPSLTCSLRRYFALACTTSEAERTFSALRRIKNYLRSTMTQCGLNFCCLLYIHSTVTDELYVKRCMDIGLTGLQFA